VGAAVHQAGEFLHRRLSLFPLLSFARAFPVHLGRVDAADVDTGFDLESFPDPHALAYIVSRSITRNCLLPIGSSAPTLNRPCCALSTIPMLS
jgi:hypothetical protein